MDTTQFSSLLRRSQAYPLGHRREADSVCKRSTFSEMYLRYRCLKGPGRRHQVEVDTRNGFSWAAGACLLGRGEEPAVSLPGITWWAVQTWASMSALVCYLTACTAPLAEWMLSVKRRGGKSWMEWLRGSCRQASLISEMKLCFLRLGLPVNLY